VSHSRNHPWTEYRTGETLPAQKHSTYPNAKRLEQTFMQLRICLRSTIDWLSTPIFWLVVYILQLRACGGPLYGCFRFAQSMECSIGAYWGVIPRCVKCGDFLDVLYNRSPSTSRCADDSDRGASSTTRRSALNLRCKYWIALPLNWRLECCLNHDFYVLQISSILAHLATYPYLTLSSSSFWLSPYFFG